jgi:DNA-binding transcriptional LysR family regulator
MELREVEAFLVLAEELSFGRAAERLFVTRPRVSQLIRDLERQVGGALVVRTSRRVVLTPLGAELAAELGSAYQGLRQALDRARAAARQAGKQLRVGFYSAVIADLLAGPLRAFARRCPEVEVVLAGVPWCDMLGPLRRGDVDVMALWTPLQEPGLAIGPAFSRQDRVIVTAAGHPLAGRGSAGLEDIADYGAFELWPPFPGPLREAVLPLAAPGGRVIDRQPVATLSQAITLVPHGLRVHASVAGAVPVFARPGLAFVPVPQLPCLSAALAWRAAATSPHIGALADTVREITADPAAAGLVTARTESVTPRSG